MAKSVKKSNHQRKRALARTKGPAFVSIYANNVELNVSPWDFRFRLGHIIEATDESVSIEETAHVYMSPQHAKAFLKVLSGTLQRYEDKFGPIVDVEQPSGSGSESEPS
jgi:hypothetical protein